MAGRGRPAHQRDRIIERALQMVEDGERINKSRIARELHVPLRSVFRVIAEDRRKRTNGNPQITKADADRFWSQVDRTPGQGLHGDCWEWTGSLASAGYPRRFTANGITAQASHVALILDGRPRPSREMYGLHSCDNKLCLNPSHLRWGTDAENHADYLERGKRGSHWLPDDIVRAIHEHPGGHKETAFIFGITPSAVCNIRAGRAHKKIFEEYRHITRV